MSRIAYVNGRYVPHRTAKVHVEDRGYQFADGIYEVVQVHGGALVDEIPHLDRLDRSLAEMRMAAPMARAPLRAVIAEVVARNRVKNGIVYLQVTRGVARRNHAFPKGVEPALVVTARSQQPAFAQMQAGIAIVTLPDLRWKRRDIKTVNLTANILAKQQAVEAGAHDAWLVEPDGTVTEATASNAWMVTAAREVLTRRADHSILNGITRLSLKSLAEAAGYRVVERAFTLKEVQEAAEAFVTGTTTWVTPVIRIDGRPVGDGKPGPLAKVLLDAYRRYADAA